MRCTHTQICLYLYLLPRPIRLLLFVIIKCHSDLFIRCINKSGSQLIFALFVTDKSWRLSTVWCHCPLITSKPYRQTVYPNGWYSLSFSLWFSKMFGSQILCCVFDDWRNLFVEKIWFKSLILIWKAWKDYDWSSKRFVLIVCDYQKPVCVHFEFPFVQYAND